MAKGGSTGWKQKSGAIKSCSAKFVFLEGFQLKIHLIRGPTNQNKMQIDTEENPSLHHGADRGRGT